MVYHLQAGGLGELAVWSSPCPKVRTRSTEVQGQERMGVPAQTVNSPSLALFVLFSPSKIWMMSTHTGEGDLLYSVYPFKC